MNTCIFEDKPVIFYCYDNIYCYFEDYVESLRAHIKTCPIVKFNRSVHSAVCNHISLQPNSIHIFLQSPIAEIFNLDPKILKNCVVLNTEQMSRENIRDVINNTVNSSKIKYLDYSLENMEFYTNKDKVIYLPYQVNSKENYNFKEKTLGVAMIPINSQYRKDIVDKVALKSVPINSVNGWGAERDNTLFKYKILLNVHFNRTYNIFEVLRCFRCLLNGVIVVSEHSTNSDLLEYKDNIIFCSYDEIADKTVEVYNNYEFYYKKVFDNLNIKELEQKLFDKLVKCFSEINP